MIVLPLTLAVMLLALTACFGWTGLKRLAEQPFAGGGYALAASGAQLVSVATGEGRLAWLGLTAILVLVFCWTNREKPGFRLVAAGITLNFAVMAANGGVMPINSETVARLQGTTVRAEGDIAFWKGHVIEDDMAALPWLGDRLLLPGPLARLAAWSVGDVLLLVGLGRLLWRTMKGTDSVRRTIWRNAPAR